MNLIRTFGRTTIVLYCLMFAFTAYAGDKNKTSTIDCTSGSLATELSKLDRSIINEVKFSGPCIEDIVIEGFRDLTLTGLDGASITATNFDPEDSGQSTVALTIRDSRVTVQTVTINSGNYGADCTRRSTCRFHDVTIQGGWNGISAQDQSSIDITGPSLIADSLRFGLSIFGGSSVNLRPNRDSNFSETDAGPTISGHPTGVFAQDGSFLRGDNVTVTGNETGVFVRRDTVLKLFTYDPGFIGVSSNTGDGIIVHQNSTAQIGVPITNNGGVGLSIGPLSFVHFFGTSSNNTSGDYSCWHSTSISQPSDICGN